MNDSVHPQEVFLEPLSPVNKPKDENSQKKIETNTTITEKERISNEIEKELSNTEEDIKKLPASNQNRIDGKINTKNPDEEVDPNEPPKSQFPRYTPDTVSVVLKPSEPVIDRKNMMITLVKQLMNDMDTIAGRENKKFIANILFNIITGFKDVLQYPNMGKFILAIKQKFHEFIVKERLHNLVHAYNKIFNDNLYDYIEMLPEKNFITQEEIDRLVKQYHSDMEDLENRRRALRLLPKYEKGEIVGAKDKEGRWWMSRVLKVFTHLEHNMYYVEFLGWGPKFNEFIVDSFRISQFNPRKHVYYRPAWKRRQNAAQAQNQRELMDKLAGEETAADVETTSD